MKMTTVVLKVPVEMKDYISSNEEELLVQQALLLYPHIKNQTISQDRAAEILGIDKWRLMDLYNRQGISYEGTIKQKTTCRGIASQYANPDLISQEATVISEAFSGEIYEND